MPPEEVQQQSQPIVDDVNGAGSPAEDVGNVAVGEQPSFQRVTPEDAETLPYDELKRRMRAERDAYDENPAAFDGTDDSEGDVGGTSDNAGSGNRQQQASGQQPDGTGQRDPNAQQLLQQAQAAIARAADLERRAAEERAQREQAAYEAQVRRAQQEIAAAPQAQQPILQQALLNQLRQQALGDFDSHLTQRAQHIQAAELRVMKGQVPDLLTELADSVAQRHNIKADRLKEYITSPQFKELVQAANTEDALTGVAANAGQWMEYLASTEEMRLANERDQRRQRAAQNPKVLRDTPAGGVPMSGGEADIVRQINTMSKEEFFAYKKKLLSQQA